MADLRRTSGLIAGAALSLGVAAAALWSTGHAWRQPARTEAENGYISALNAAMLDPQQARPAAPAALASPAARLAHRPLDRGALAQVALEATLVGKRDVARPIMQEVVRRDPRAKAGRIWLMADALRRDDLRAATGQIERLMAIDPAQSLAYFPILADIAKQRGGERLIAGILSRGPMWRTQFLGFLTTRGVVPELIFRLNTGPSGNTKVGGEPAQAALIQQFIARGDYDGAYVAWVNFLPPAALAKVTTVYDGGFAGLPGPQPFNWSFNDGDAASVGIDRGHGLHIEYSGAQTARLASQTVLLKPGSYRLDYTAQGTGELADGGAISWRLLCVPDNKPVLDLPITGLTDRTVGRAARFTVPVGCNAQLLSIDATLGTFPQSRSLTIAQVAINRGP
ncbi:MAG: hypothetical protein JWL96_3548 [Sphingomonas bacterium]|uniref:tetratricopeptide repeat protein n=1 Tax=Sphingomonas bacterium TaxID=1895847 RepID=UPI00262C34C5|nr:hypothetical protein [Sphingomonas bacterium]MDB5711478.1 hypothetical protein [Sphingomonas bacterium]